MFSSNWFRFPDNEEETIQLFKLASARLGWRLVHLQSAFPDAIIENGRGQRLVVEFELKSGSFKDHGHDPEGCDLIIAYWDTWENPPVPVWELKGCTRAEANAIEKIIRLRKLQASEAEGAKEELLLANERILELENAIINQWMPLVYKKSWGERLSNFVLDNLMSVYLIIMFVGMMGAAILGTLMGRVE